MIPYGKHSIFPEDIEAVTKVLQDGFLTQGEQTPLFEKAVSNYTGARYGVACNSGTSGLHIACLAAGVSRGDLVWTVPNSFAASANCARYCGADVDFVDIDPLTRNLSVSALEDKLKVAIKNRRLPKLLIVVHFAGSSCDMAAIAKLTTPLGIALIEDAAHALGGKDSEGNKVGACKYSLMSVLSFHPVKSITSAEGGMVVTNDEKVATLLCRYRSHGISRGPHLFEEAHLDEPWFYAQYELGFNYRLSDLHAVLGLSQLNRLDEFVSLRRGLAQRYNTLLDSLPVKKPIFDENSAWHLYMIEVPEHDRKRVFNQMRERGVGVNVHYIPIHLHPYYRNLGFKVGQFPNAEQYYSHALTLPLYPSLKQEEQHFVVSQLEEILL
ncbi:UDP-4-amino-4,6-dideoxy-N-acetyl-beta-L-altrosamine transaminase [Alteromonas australica]|uniref:Spore coat protein n=1 Tax=Alteromonas australica TaxID=589873 RepID=A0A075NTY2_9ALTE|nr:UDP-4-amino-4,6-dideoxy-N-acetyl-beta-L-altrosamine transaminase [Alteromonas australica]AIF98124.1 spore coat protein [Alteromonas australica]